MGFFSLLRKSKQESVPNDAEFRSRAAEESNAVRSRRKRKQGVKQGSADEEPVDPVLPEKKRARRRLIGAVALVLAAVIGLPMILDSEPKPLADDIAIQIPSKDKAAPPAKERSAVPPPPAGKISAATGLDKNEEIIALPPVTAANSMAAIPPAASKSSATQYPAANPNGKPESRPEHKLAAKPEAKASVQPQEGGNQEDATRARALLEAKPEVKAEKTKASFEKKPARFIIQVAALGSQEKANELQGKLKSAGIRSQTQKIATQSGERIRVRVGPFPSRDEAEKVRARLIKMGLSGTLVPA